MNDRAVAVARTAIFLAAVAGAGAGMTAARAGDDSIKVSKTVPYADLNVGSAAIRSECDWNKVMVDRLVDYSHGQIEATDEDLANVHGRKLVLSITGAHSTGGGQVGTNFGAGDKYGAISGKLMSNDQVIDEFQLTRKSGGGFLVFSACGTLDRIAKALASDTWHHLQEVAKNPQPQPMPMTITKAMGTEQPRISWKPGTPGNNDSPASPTEAK